MTEPSGAAGPAVPPPKPRSEPASEAFVVWVAVAAVVVMTIMLAWMRNQQSEELENLRSEVGSSQEVVSTPMDPEVCWVMGANAHATGRGVQMSQMLSKATTLTDCVMQAQRGALGQGPGN
ncbi:hypothetical protein GCM10027053_27450 [Intrasporangium mesophilum]